MASKVLIFRGVKGNTHCKMKPNQVEMNLRLNPNPQSARYSIVFAFLECPLTFSRFKVDPQTSYRGERTLVTQLYGYL